MTTYDASDRRHVRSAEKSAKSAAAQRLDIVRGIMSVAAGRAWMLDLLEACHIFNSSYHSEALAMAFAEGERNVGLRLLADVMSAGPKHYLLMMEERSARDATADRRRDAVPDRNGDAGRSEQTGDADSGADEGFFDH